MGWALLTDIAQEYSSSENILNVALHSDLCSFQNLEPRFPRAWDDLGWWYGANYDTSEHYEWVWLYVYLHWYTHAHIYKIVVTYEHTEDSGYIYCDWKFCVIPSVFDECLLSHFAL
jgi:hypothetical protein